MSIEKHKAMLHHWIDGWNTHDIHLIDRLANEIWSADIVIHDAGKPGAIVGSQGIREFVHQKLKEQADIKVVIDDIVAEGDTVACRLTVIGTNSTTGKTERLFLLQTYRFSAEKIAEAWGLEAQLN
jgi:predicted ester cyclase